MAEEERDKKTNGSGKNQAPPRRIAVIGSLLVAVVAAATAYYQMEKAKFEAEKAKVEADRANKLELQVDKLTTPAGHYGWEVASERWWGYIDVDDRGVSDIQMWKFAECPDGRKKLWLFEQVQGTTPRMKIDQNNRLEVNFPVQQIRYDDKCNRVGLDAVETLKGYLEQTKAYDGEIRYEAQNGQAPTGGMILVRTLPGGR